MKPYDIFGIKRKLFARHGTVAELSLEKGEILNRYLCFESAKRGIELHLLQHFKGMREYEEITKQIQFDKYKKTIFKSQRYSYIERDLTDSKPFHDYVTVNRGQPTQRGSNQVDIEKGFINALDVSVIWPELPNSGLKKSLTRPKDNEDELVEVCLDSSVIVAGDDMLDESEEIKLPVAKDLISQESEVESIPLLNQDVANMLATTKNDKVAEVERKIEKMQISSSNVSVNISEAEKKKSQPEVGLSQPTGINSMVTASGAPSPSLIKLPLNPPATKLQTEPMNETPVTVKKPNAAPKKSYKPADDD